jgi:hypothetical protein
LIGDQLFGGPGDVVVERAREDDRRAVAPNANLLGVEAKCFRQANRLRAAGTSDLQANWAACRAA